MINCTCAIPFLDAFIVSVVAEVSLRLPELRSLWRGSFLNERIDAQAGRCVDVVGVVAEDFGNDGVLLRKHQRVGGGIVIEDDVASDKAYFVASRAVIVPRKAYAREIEQAVVLFAYTHELGRLEENFIA